MEVLYQKTVTYMISDEYYSNDIIVPEYEKEKRDIVLSDKEYIRHSLELNLFFLRIVKEHAIFAAASLAPGGRAVAGKLIAMKNSFEELLSEAIELGDRLVSHDVIASEELVTDLTLEAELKTQFLTGIPINTDLTRRELELRADRKYGNITELKNEVNELNRKAMTMTRAAIAFKNKLLSNVLECKAFSYTYPSMLHHVIEESEYYVMLLEKLEKRDAIDSIKEVIDAEINWNHIMEEHSEFIRGYLDPEEKKLIKTADAFASEFEGLVEKSEQAREQKGLVREVTSESRRNVTAIRNFKVQGTEGILKCKIKSVIPPLLSDHVTREANHFLRLLKSFERML
jgi:hypothetical protein